jgi:hypothetical protein
MREITDYIMAHWAQMIEFLKENGETIVLAVLKRLDVSRLNEVMCIFMRLIKSVEGNFPSYFNTFPMLQKLMLYVGFGYADTRAEAFIKVASEHSS